MAGAGAKAKNKTSSQTNAQGGRQLNVRQLTRIREQLNTIGTQLDGHIAYMEANPAGRTTTRTETPKARAATGG